ncbi:MAG: DUF4261 domain-containing protein [Butyrivibrio sp.]|nr:DUF4261 domain-containing protein [Muribaculum sp.]MCM1551741.1 DUF4261 domain-containing protein [Butyrivibrio sp.]
MVIIMIESDKSKIDNAVSQLEEWLSDPRELGKKPSKVEYVESFEDEDGISCMIFKFKKSMLSKWLLGIVSDSGVFSDMKEFDEGRARQDAEECLTFLKNYWKNLAAKQAGTENQEYEGHKGAFAGFILLSDKSWDKEQFKRDLKADWGIDPEYDEGDDSYDREGDGCDAMLFELGSQRVVLGYMNVPVPGGEAEENAAYNYMWQEAVEVTKTHQAQIMVAVLGEHRDIKQDGLLFVKLVSSLCKQPNAIGVYANGVVYEPKFYFAMKEFIENGMYPLMGVVWFGMLRSEKGINLYTLGMDSFGKAEMEILDVTGDFSDARDFLTNIAGYCIDQDVVLHDGETIGLTADQRCRITKSPGVSVEGETLKIAYSE